MKRAPIRSPDGNSLYFDDNHSMIGFGGDDLFAVRLEHSRESADRRFDLHDDIFLLGHIVFNGFQEKSDEKPVHRD